jgi:hypothetical protein
MTKKYKELKLEYMDLEEDYNRLKGKIKHSGRDDTSVSSEDSESDSGSSEDESKSRKSSASKRSSRSSSSKKSKKKMDSVKITDNRDPNDVLKKRELAQTTASKANNKISNIKIKSFDTRSVVSGKSSVSKSSDTSKIDNDTHVDTNRFFAIDKPKDTQPVEIPNSRLTIGGKKLSITKTLPPDHVVELKNPINPLTKPVHTMFKQSTEIQNTTVSNPTVSVPVNNTISTPTNTLTYKRPSSMMSFGKIEEDENSVLG